jgi:quinolinate synthase
MSDIAAGIEAIRSEWGERLLILGHHYQRSAVVAHADAAGDSLELARKASLDKKVERIVFCGVHFMAESADILSGPEQAVYMPETTAGCPMADMADAADMEAAWQVLDSRGGDWLPVVYVNSTAAVKAVCGRHGGSCCTSSKAARVFQWAFDQGKRVFFLPDEHLGANSAHDLGVPDSAVAIYNPRLPNGGLTDAEIENARVVVWKGFCIVHQAFSVKQVQEVRRQLPEAKIIVHPESPKEAVRLCDAHGSTAQIIDYVNQAADGETIVIGTEFNLVQRLAEIHRDRLQIKALKASVCANMAKTSEANLLKLLESWDPSALIRVESEVAAEARLSLERMLAI